MKDITGSWKTNGFLWLWKKSALESNETRLESDFSLKEYFYERRSLLIERHKIIRLVKHVQFKRLERQVVLILSVKNLAQSINTFWTKILEGPVTKALGGRALKKWSISELLKRKVRFQNKLVKLKQVGLSTYMWKAMRALMWGDISPYWEVVIYTL